MIISCNIKHLKARCEQRGYSLEEVKDCIVSRDGDNINVDIDHPSYPRYPKSSSEINGPSLIEKAKNFAKAAMDHVKAGMPIASDEEIEKRFSICQTCEFLKNNACTKCGCPVNREKKFISKLAWADQKCPIGKW